MKLHLRYFAVAEVVYAAFLVVYQGFCIILFPEVIFTQLITEHLYACCIIFCCNEFSCSLLCACLIHFKPGNYSIVPCLQLCTDGQLAKCRWLVSYVFEAEIGKTILLFLIELFCQFKLSIRVYIGKCSLCR